MEASGSPPGIGMSQVLPLFDQQITIQEVTRNMRERSSNLDDYLRKGKDRSKTKPDTIKLMGTRLEKTTVPSSGQKRKSWKKLLRMRMYRMAEGSYQI